MARGVRQGLEEASPETLEQVLDEAENTGIAPYILRMSIALAGAEVKLRQDHHRVFIKEMDLVIGKLVRGQEDALLAQRQLACAKAQLAAVTLNKNDKAKQMLMSMMSGASEGLLLSVMQAWSTTTQKLIRETLVRREYQSDIDIHSQALIEAKQKQLQAAHNVMQGKSAENIRFMMEQCFRVWSAEALEQLAAREAEKSLDEMCRKMDQVGRKRADNAKKLISSLNDNNEISQLNLAFLAWMNFHTDYQKEKEQEESIRKVEKKLAAFMKSKSEQAKKIVASMQGGTDTGCMKLHFDAWAKWIVDVANTKRIEGLMHTWQTKQDMFFKKQKKTANNVMMKQALNKEHILLMKCLHEWAFHQRIEYHQRDFNGKIDAKRTKLVSVQLMFRNFSVELEKHGKNEPDSERCEPALPSTGKKIDKQTEALSLPAISKSPSKPALAARSERSDSDDMKGPKTPPGGIRNKRANREDQSPVKLPAPARSRFQRSETAEAAIGRRKPHS